MTKKVKDNLHFIGAIIGIGLIALVCGYGYMIQIAELGGLK